MARVVVSLLALALLGGLSLWLYVLGPDALAGPATQVLPLLSLPLFALYLLSALLVWRRPRGMLVPVLALAVVFRVVSVGEPPLLSSDCHRYAWDGLVQRAGHSPYAFPPQDPALESLRDELIHPRINRPSARTIYPPGAQLLYRFIPYDIDLLRLVMVLFDLLTMGLIALLLRRLGKEPAKVVLYAWSPLVVLEVGNGGHMEAAMLPLLVGAVLALHASRHRLVGLLLGQAVAMKLYPALALAALARGKPWRVLGCCALVVVGLYGLYGYEAGLDVLGFLPDYVRTAEDHNVGLRRLLESALSPVFERPRTPAFLLCLAVLGFATVWIRRRGGPVVHQLGALVGVYLLTLPTAFHPWYALWWLPWICFRPRASALWLSATLPLSYLKYASPDGVMPTWVPLIEFIPAGLFFLAEERPWRR